MKVVDSGRTYDVASPNVNSEYKLVGNAQYPQMAKNFERTFQTLNSIPCDIFLGAHGSYLGLEEKYSRLKKGGANPFVDPAGYKSYVADWEKAFRAELWRQERQ
jgi:metallo-beta-lactamase class B